MKLLIVDDSAMIRRAITTAYKGTTFTEIKTASDGLLAVTMFKQFAPDVVTLDITMPHMDGLAALSQMLRVNPHAKVLVISALADHHTAIESLSRGAEQFICKPFTSEDLREALDDLMIKKNTAPVAVTHKVYTDEMNVTARIEKMNNSSLVSNKAPSITEINSSTPPSQHDYPSGYVAPPVVKKPVSWANYHEEMTKPPASKNTKIN